MSSPTLATGRKPRRLAFKIIAGILGAIVLVVIGACTWFYLAARRALPQLDGTVRVSGITSSITVTRDSHGVPHISAANMQDLLFAQGYVTAQDRLWQMDMTRRYGAGELSEILGADYIKLDRTQRILGLTQIAQRAAAEMSVEDRTLADAYVRGVNAYISERASRLPLEFRLIGYTPRPWTIEDSLVVGATFSEMLNLGAAYHILQRERVEAKVSPELAADLFPTTSWRDHPPAQAELPIVAEPELPDNEMLRQEEEFNRSHPPRPRRHPQKKAAPQQVTSLEQSAFSGQHKPANHRADMNYVRDTTINHRPPTIDFPVSDQRPESNDLTASDHRPPTIDRFAIDHRPETSDFSPGSNNWVVSGAHTTTGKPLLSNDMHLEHHIPNVWYEVHLTSGDFDAAGVSAPGIPFIVEGHNRRIAWGYTNLNPAAVDLYVETVNGSGQYQTPSGWQQPQRRHEVIRVKKAAPVELDVLTTRHGPIVSELVPGESRTIALRWTMHDKGTLNLTVFRKLNAAGNWEEFRDALRLFGSPGQNVVYADVDGHIGYQATGFVPVRKAGDGTRPVPGNTDDYEWTGYLPFDDMPRVYDPESGIIATANNRTTPDGYQHLVSAEWFSPERVDRIWRVLHSGKQFTADDMLKLQTDVYSALDHFCANRFVYAVDHSSRASARAKQAADLMRNWNGRITIDSAAPSIAVRARTELRRLLLQPVLGDDAKFYTWGTSYVWLENTLQRRPARWLPRQYATWDDLLADAVNRAVEENAPKDLSQWTWSGVGQLYLQHPIFGRIPLLNRWTGPGLQPQSGDGLTVKQVGHGFGPSQRFTADLSDLDHSHMNIVTGQSGMIFSPYYMDQWPAWYRGTTYMLPFTTPAVQQARAHQLRLVP